MRGAFYSFISKIRDFSFYSTSGNLFSSVSNIKYFIRWSFDAALARIMV